MKSFIKHITIVLIVSVIGVNIVSYASLRFMRNASFYKPSFLVNSVEEETFDYIILGASTGLTTLNTKVIDSILGTDGINLSMDDTGIASQQLMLEHFLNQGKTSKYCILAPNAMSYDANYYSVSDNDYRFLPFVNETYIHDYYNGYNDFESNVMSLSKHLPFVGVSYYNAELLFPSVYSAVNKNKRNRFDDRGNYTYPERNTTSVQISSKSECVVKFQNSNLATIQKLCEANDIELIYYISPMREVSVKTKDQDTKVINHSDILDNTEYFYDAIHVNKKGRRLTSHEFAIDFQMIMNTQ